MNLLLRCWSTGLRVRLNRRHRACLLLCGRASLLLRRVPLLLRRVPLLLLWLSWRMILTCRVRLNWRHRVRLLLCSRVSSLLLLSGHMIVLPGGMSLNLRSGIAFHLPSRISAVLLPVLLILRPRLRCSRCGMVRYAQRPRGNYVLWVAAIRLGKRASVCFCSLHMLRLVLGRGHMLLAGCNPLLGSGLMLNPARTAVVSDVTVPGHCISFHNRAVNVSGVDDGLIYVHYRGVIGKLVAAPLAA